MNYDVFLSLEAVEDVLRITIASETKAVIVDAAKRIQEALILHPRNAGNHLSEGLYFVDCDPLRAFFTVDDDNGEVEIVNVRHLRF